MEEATPFAKLDISGGRTDDLASYDTIQRVEHVLTFTARA